VKATKHDGGGAHRREQQRGPPHDAAAACAHVLARGVRPQVGHAPCADARSLGSRGSRAAPDGSASM
jgi:hypothetical protein